ncbi:MAG: hypothetical protein HY722_09970 [Planctomycetes bacterium]|nr:hypothetical protein [Planctomycetota bacterium]
MAVVALAVAGCHEVEIAEPADGASFRAGQGVRLRARSSKHVDHTEWFVDGAHAGKGEVYTATALSPGWHQVEARLGEPGHVKKDRIHVEVVSWTASTAPWRATPAALAHEPASGAIWAAVPGEGVYRVAPSGQARLHGRAGGELPSDEALALAVRPGEVWVATGAGAVRHDGSTWRTTTSADGLPSDEVRALAVDPADGRLWAVTPEGLASWDGSAWRGIAHKAPATSLAVEGGVAWLGTDGAGLHRYDGAAWDVLDGNPGLDQDRLLAVAADTAAPRRAWYLARDEGLAKHRDGAWERHYHDASAPLHGAALAVDPRDRTLWLADPAGLGLRRRGADGRWRRLDAAGAVPGLAAPWRAMALGPSAGRLWLATDGHLVSVEAGGAQPHSPLPDLVAYPPEALGIALAGAQRELRLTATTANLGDGALEIEGVVDPAQGRTVAVQHLFRGDRVAERIHTGNFVFAAHQQHNHMHFDGFTSYQLREVLPGRAVGPVVRQSAKVSFCLMDFSNVGGRGDKVYTCDPGLQGISVGWADTYASGLDGQLIPLDGVGAGEFWVVCTVTSVFAEKDYANNTAMKRVSLDGAYGVTVLEEVRGAR